MFRLNELEKTTFKYHLIFSVLNGVLNGGLVLQEIIVRKTLHSSNLVVTFVTMVWPVSNLFSIYWGEYIEGKKDRGNLFLIAGFFGRLSLILTLFVKTGGHLLLLLLLVYSFNAFIIPVQNSIFQFNYREKVRGILFGFSQSVYSLALLSTSLIFGKLLDYKEQLFRPLFVFIGILGFFAILALKKIRIRTLPVRKRRTKSNFLVKPIIVTLQEFRENKAFLLYEIAFFIYGIGYLSVLPIIPQFLVNKLKMTYTQISIGRVVIAQLGIALLAPLSGFVQGLINPLVFSGLSFLILGFYPILLAFSIFQGIMDPIRFVYIAFAVFSIGMAGVMITWTLGSIYFARGKDAALHQSVHVTLTAFRGLIAPPLGYFLMTRFSDTVGFFNASFMFFVGAVIMFITYWKYKNYER